MAEPFLAEIRMFSFNFAPRGWATCDGQLLPISQNQALFALLMTTYGGDGRTNFNLPDLRGRVPIQPTTVDTTVQYGKPGGTVVETLSAAQMPAHTHPVLADNTTGTSVSPIVSEDGGTWAAAPQNPYTTFASSTAVPLNSAAITSSGSSQAHSNMQPYETINFCIALTGIFPSRP